LIREVGGEHSVIISTHILPEVEMVCDHVQIIDKGKLVFNGSIDVLKRQRIGNKLLVGLHHAPNTDELLKINGVSEAEVLPSGLMRVRFEDGAAPAEAIVQAAVQQGWGLYQIAPDQTSLEDVFMQLTYQEQLISPEQSTA
jgi:ABC-2 type transport system ATP-binding protein